LDTQNKSRIENSNTEQDTSVFPFDICISAAKHVKKPSRGKADKAKSNASREKGVEQKCVPSKL
jgi:hypothetical protein